MSWCVVIAQVDSTVVVLRLCKTCHKRGTCTDCACGGGTPSGVGHFRDLDQASFLSHYFGVHIYFYSEDLSRYELQLVVLSSGNMTIQCTCM